MEPPGGACSDTSTTGSYTSDDNVGCMIFVLDTASDYFRQHGLLSEYSDAKGFHPHLTIMKLSKAPRLRKQG